LVASYTVLTGYNHNQLSNRLYRVNGVLRPPNLRLLSLSLKLDTHYQCSWAVFMNRVNTGSVCRALLSNCQSNDNGSLKPHLHDTAGCQTGYQTGMTTGCSIVQPVGQPAASCIQTSNRLSTGCTNRFDNRLYRVNGLQR